MTASRPRRPSSPGEYQLLRPSRSREVVKLPAQPRRLAQGTQAEESHDEGVAARTVTPTQRIRADEITQEVIPVDFSPPPPPPLIARGSVAPWATPISVGAGFAVLLVLLALFLR